jgi:beta-lactamase superfamily II metal-dependent hydrolase
MSWRNVSRKARPASRSFVVSGYALALLVVLCLPARSALAADCVVPSAHAANAVTLRAAPTASSLERGTLRPGENLPLVASMPGWYETNLDGKPAFAAKRSTAIAACPVATATVPSGATFELHAIDVGTGLAVLVRGADFAVLYDAGSNDDLALGDDNRVIAYLETLRPPLEKIDHVILSHPHRDHVELLPDVLTKFKPTEVWNSGAFNNICGYRNFLLAIAADPSVQYHTETEEGGIEKVELAEKRCYKVDQPEQTVILKHAKRINAGEKIALGRGATMTFLYADGSKHASFNENSLVVRLDLGSHRVLLMGDAEAGGRQPPSTKPKPSSVEGELLVCCKVDVKADVLVVGHHGSKTSSRTTFLDAVGAQIFIVSAGPTKYATVVLPDDEVVSELEERGEVFRTDDDDEACAMSSDKVGPKADGKPGGCDNVLVTIPANGPVVAEYRHP